MSDYSKTTSKKRAPCFMDSELLESIKVESKKRNTSIYRYTNYLIENSLYIENTIGIPLSQVREFLEILKSFIEAGGMIVPVVFLNEYCNSEMWRVYGKSVIRSMRNSKKKISKSDLLNIFLYFLRLIPGNSISTDNNTLTILSAYLKKSTAECISNFFYSAAETAGYGIKIDIDENYMRVLIE